MPRFFGSREAIAIPGSFIMVSARKRANRIRGLNTDQNVWVTEQSDLNDVVVSYPNNLFAASDNLGDVS